MAKMVRLGSGTGSVVNHLMSAGSGAAPAVGEGCTVLLWTDRTAGTIVSVSRSGRSFVVREDTATRTDRNGLSEAQSYEFSPNPNGRTWTVRMTKAGWRTSGGARHGCGVLIGARHAYRDPSF